MGVRRRRPRRGVSARSNRARPGPRSCTVVPGAWNGRTHDLHDLCARQPGPLAAWRIERQGDCYPSWVGCAWLAPARASTAWSACVCLGTGQRAWLRGGLSRFVLPKSSMKLFRGKAASRRLAPRDSSTIGSTCSSGMPGSAAGCSHTSRRKPVCQNVASRPASGITSARNPSAFSGTSALTNPIKVSRQRFTRPPIDTS